MRALYVETSVLLLAAGGDHPLREGSRRLVEAVGRGEVRAHTSVETIQEFVHHLWRRADDRAVARARGVMAMCTLQAFDEEVLEKSLDLIDAGVVRGRDAVHAATALDLGLREIVSADRHFDAIPGLIRVSPSAWDA